VGLGASVTRNCSLLDTHPFTLHALLLAELTHSLSAHTHTDAFPPPLPYPLSSPLLSLCSPISPKITTQQPPYLSDWYGEMKDAIVTTPASVKSLCDASASASSSILHHSPLLLLPNQPGTPRTCVTPADFSDTPDVLLTVVLAEPEILVEAESHVVAVKPVR